MLEGMTDKPFRFIEPKPLHFSSQIWDIEPGTIIFIKGEFGKLHDYFKGRDYELFPMTWRDYYIYRKRGVSAA